MIKVLDHGYVRLVDSMGDDHRICDAARVSHGQDGIHDPERNRKLIHYLWQHNHGTPFEKVVFEFEVKLPIFVMRQLVRHRIASINEISARYTELPDEFYIPSPEVIGVQSRSNKQGREILPIPEARAVCLAMRAQSEAAFNTYKTLLAQGIPRELARIILPLNTYTRIYWTINLRSLANFLTLRLDSHAQYEIREYAKAFAALAREVAPWAMEEILSCE